MAVRFDADGETLSISSGLPSSTAFTLCGWYKRRGGGSGTNEMLCGMYGADAPNAYIAVFTYSLSTYAFRVQTNAGSISSAGLSITDDAWYFCALSCGGTGAADAKVRAAALGSASLTTVSAAGSSFVPVGLSLDVAGFGTWSNQALSGFKLFDRVLTDAELLAEMNRLTPASTTNLSAWWPLVGDTIANAVKDYSGNGRDWTANGTLTIEDGPPVTWGGKTLFVNKAISAGASVAGQVVSSTASIIKGTVTAGASVASKTLTATASLLGGAVTVTASVAGQTLIAIASVIAGTITGGASVASQTLTAIASLIAGSATGSSGGTVLGTILTTTASLIAGGITAGASVASKTLTATASLVTGAVTAGSVVLGKTVTATASMIAGSVSAIQNATVNGITVVVGASLIAGNALIEGSGKVYRYLISSVVQPLVKRLVNTLTDKD